MSTLMGLIDRHYSTPYACRSNMYVHGRYTTICRRSMLTFDPIGEVLPLDNQYWFTPRATNRVSRMDELAESSPARAMSIRHARNASNID